MKASYFVIILLWLLIQCTAVLAETNRSALVREFKAAQACVHEALANEAYPKALECTKKSVSLGDKLFKPNSKNLAILTLDYGMMLWKKSPYFGIKKTKEAIKLHENAFGVHSREFSLALIELARMQSTGDTSDRNNSFENFTQALENLASLEINDDYAHSALVFIQNSQVSEMTDSQLQFAAFHGSAAFAIFKNDFGVHDVKTRALAFELGEVYFFSEKYKKSIQMFKLVPLRSKMCGNEAFTFTDAVGGKGENVRKIYDYFGRSYEKLGNQKAAGHFFELVRLFDEVGVISPPCKRRLNPTKVVAPIYPSRAKRSGQEGYAIIEVIVLPSGNVESPKLVEESPEGWGFGNAAMRVANKLKYKSDKNRNKRKVLFKYNFKMNK